MNRRTRLALGGDVLLVVVLGVRFTSPAAVLTQLAWLASNPLLFAVVLVGVALVRPFLAWPTTLLAVACGYGFGLLVGLPFALALMTVTALPPFLLARRARGSGRMTDVSEQFVQRTGDFRSVAASRFLPAPSDVVSIAAGVANVSVLPFLAGTAVGELPWALAGVFLGSSLDVLSADSLASVVDARLVAAVALVGLLALAGPLYRYLSDATPSESASRRL